MGHLLNEALAPVFGRGRRRGGLRGRRRPSRWSPMAVSRPVDRLPGVQGCPRRHYRADLRRTPDRNTFQYCSQQVAGVGLPARPRSEYTAVTATAASETSKRFGTRSPQESVGRDAASGGNWVPFLGLDIKIRHCSATPEAIGSGGGRCGASRSTMYSYVIPRPGARHGRPATITPLIALRRNHLHLGVTERTWGEHESRSWSRHGR